MDKKSIFELHPLPWEVVRAEQFDMDVHDGNGKRLRPDNEFEILSAMVQAVNSHEELIKIVEEYYHLMSAISSELPQEYDPEIRDLKLRSKSALARAKGE